VDNERTNFPNRLSAEPHYTKHVRMSTDEGADKETVRTDINEKLQRGWRLVSMVPGIGSGSTALWVVVAVLGIVACMLLVYAGAVLLARLVVWTAYYP
jgi:hypothetical protein